MLKNITRPNMDRKTLLSKKTCIFLEIISADSFVCETDRQSVCRQVEFEAQESSAREDVKEVTYTSVVDNFENDCLRTRRKQEKRCKAMHADEDKNADLYAKAGAAKQNESVRVVRIRAQVWLKMRTL